MPDCLKCLTSFTLVTAAWRLTKKQFNWHIGSARSRLAGNTGYSVHTTSLLEASGAAASLTKLRVSWERRDSGG